MGIPFGNEGHDALGQMIQAGEITDAEPFALEDTEPLLYLIHPRAMHRSEVTHEARMSSQPCLHKLAFVHLEIIHNQDNMGERGRKLLVE